MSLAIEGITLIINLTIETLNREVKQVALVKLNVEFIACDFLIYKVVGNEVLHLVDPMIDRNE